ncbi:MAG: L-serine ammonia-lyase, iron-sulfur-dependent, subunit alpha [Deltaproteobacteria bacterium]
MNTLRELYRIGRGPSSSHTMGPYVAAARFLKKYPDASSFGVALHGSLAATGRGHGTDGAILESLKGYKVEFTWKPDHELPLHPNGMRFEALDQTGKVIGSMEEYSVGGGALLSDAASARIYPPKTLSMILEHCEESGERFWDYVVRYEGAGIIPYLVDIWRAMVESVESGVNSEGLLPGPLGLSRKSRCFYRKSLMMEPVSARDAVLAAYAYGVAEENACGHWIVTAPTCGASGVVPAVIYYLKNRMNCTDQDIVCALGTAGLFGNIVKEYGSISGAAVGCQGEVGTACAMAAAAAAQLMGGSPRQIEYAAEMGLEHHLGLTCDPVCGLVQIPCIERNAHAAIRALTCANLALLSDGIHRISFDDVVQVLLETGKALPNLYRETSTGGLAKIYEKRIRQNAKAER